MSDLSALLDYIQRGGVPAILLLIIFFLVWQVIGGLLNKRWVPGWLYQEAQETIEEQKETIAMYEREIRDGLKTLLERRGRA